MAAVRFLCKGGCAALSAPAKRVFFRRLTSAGVDSILRLKISCSRCGPCWPWRAARLKEGIPYDGDETILALALAGLLLVGLLAGCGRRSTSAASSVSQAPSSSESQPASSVPAQTEASTPSATPDEDENSVLTISDPAAAFASCLGWGPGSAGSSLKSVQAAADLLAWAEQNQLSRQGPDLLAGVFGRWYDGLEPLQQENLAEVWPLVQADAAALLTAKSDMLPRIQDAGLDPTCCLAVP